MAKRVKQVKKPRGITPEFEDALNAADTAGLKGMIVTMQQQLAEVASFLKGEDDTEAYDETEFDFGTDDTYDETEFDFESDDTDEATLDDDTGAEVEDDGDGDDTEPVEK